MKHYETIEWRHQTTGEFEAMDVTYWVEGGTLHIEADGVLDAVPLVDGELADAPYSFEMFLKDWGCSDSHYGDIIEEILDTVKGDK